MTGPSALRRRVLASAGALALACTGTVLTASPAFAGPGHTTVVSDTPSNKTPNIMDGEVDAIYDNGTTVFVGGTFTKFRPHGDSTSTGTTQAYLLAFSKATGDVIPGFAPVLDNPVFAIAPGPDANSIYIGGQFTKITVGGTVTNRRKLAQIQAATGAPVTAFANPAFNSNVNDIQKVGGHLLVGGIFTTMNGGATSRPGLVSLNPTTGADDGFLTTALTVNHNWTTGSTGAKSGVGASKIAVAPDGASAVVIGNFKLANGVSHDQAVRLDLTTSPATVLSWNAPGFTTACNKAAFDSWVRDVKYSPDGSYFMIVGTGGPFGNTVLCDSISKWSAATTTGSASPVWVNWTGGDTVLSTAITEQAIYVGGHLRWLNNSLGGDNAKPGAVGRASIAALDPVSGLPLKWNPGRNPRGFGVTFMAASTDGLWLGYDTDYLGNNKYLRQRVGFFPLAGGLAPVATTTSGLPGKVYLGGPPAQTSNVLYRVNAGGPAVTATDGGPDWAADNTDASAFRNTNSNVSTWSGAVALHASLPAGTPTALFNDDRWDDSAAPELGWHFDVPAGTQVQVRLYFAEQFTGTEAVGKRVFNVSLDGTKVMANYDIFKDVGKSVGVMKILDTVSDGTVNIDFGHVTQNPLIDAIEIVKTDGSNVAYRVNAGGPALASTDNGPAWAADNADPSPVRNTGSTISNWANTLTRNTNLPTSTPMALFNHDRWDGSASPELQWTFAVPAGTHVQVRLYFAEQFSGTGTTGKRVFNVNIDGKTVLGSFDIVKDTGFKQAEMRAFDIVSDGTVNVDFGHITQNPLIDAIEIVKTDIAAAGFGPGLNSRSFDGSGTPGAIGSADAGGLDWSTVRGAFWVGGTLFYGATDGKLHQRTFDGTTFGTASVVDPYHDALWDTVNTGTSGQTFAGATSAFYDELSGVSGMFYSAGRLYYALTGQDGLYWRWFTPDTGTVGADKFQVTGATGFATVRSMFASDGYLYQVTSTGTLTRRTFSSDGVPGATATTIPGAADWTARVVFLAP